MKKLALSLIFSLISFTPTLAQANVSYEFNPYISEGGSSTELILRFAQKPSSAVSINLNGSGQCMFSSKDSKYSGPMTIVSSGQNYFIDVKAVDDSKLEGSHECVVDINYSSSDKQYNFSDQIKFFISDNNDHKTDYSINLEHELVSELKEGSNFLYGVKPVLSTMPEDEVFIEFAADEQCNLIVNENGQDIARKSHEVALISRVGDLVRVKPVDDNVYEGEHSCSVSASVSTIDLNYKNAVIQPLTLKISDNDSNPYVNEAENQTEIDFSKYIDLNSDGTNDHDQKQIGVFFNKSLNEYQALEAENCVFKGSVVWRNSFESTTYNLPFGTVLFDLDCQSQEQATLKWYLNGQDQLEQVLLINLEDSDQLGYVYAGNSIEFILKQDDFNKEIALGYLADAEAEEQILSRVQLTNHLNNAVFYSLILVVAVVASGYYLQKAPLDRFYKKAKQKVLRKPRITKK